MAILSPSSHPGARRPARASPRAAARRQRRQLRGAGGAARRCVAVAGGVDGGRSSKDVEIDGRTKAKHMKRWRKHMERWRKHMENIWKTYGWRNHE